MPSADDPFTDASAWDKFCDSMKAAGHDLLGSTYPDDAADRAEGFVHLALLFQMATLWFVVGADPDYPRFVNLNDTFELADNRFAAVRGDASYLIRGNVSTLFDLNLSLHEGWAFQGERGVWGDVGLSDLETGPGGSLEVVVSPEPCDGNWLPIPEAATLLQLREYYADWSTHSPGEFEIIRLGSEGHAPPRMTPDDLASRLARAARWAAEYTPGHMAMVDYLRASTPNQMLAPGRQAGGNSNIAYAFGRFELAPDESMVLEFERPSARLWGVHWLTIPWYENPDVANRITSVNSHDAHVDTDGLVRVVLGAEDGGAPNWLDTDGYTEGIVVARFVWGVDDGPELRTSTVPTAQVRDLLPIDSPAMNAEDRSRVQSMRRAHFARRKR
jgi:hypothetical protein